MKDELSELLNGLAQSPRQPIPLARAALLIARDEYQWLNVETYLNRLTFWGDAIRPHLQKLPLEGQIKSLSEWIFGDLGFEGNKKDYYDPSNSYLNDVIEKRKGIPISLSVITMAIGERAGLYSEGVGLPGHFIIRFVDKEEAIYIDPFSKGRILTIHDCVNLVEQSLGHAPPLSQELLMPTPPAIIVARMLNNLRSIYEGRGDYVRAVKVIRRMKQLQPNDYFLKKDLAICLTQAGQPIEAIAELRDCLNQKPEDQEELAPWLKQAEREKSRMN